MEISAKVVMDLRKRTGLGMMECKEALTATSGDMDAAVAYLREKLGKKMEVRSDRAATEGAIAIAQTPASVVLVALSAESDFAAKNDTFIHAAQTIANMALQQPDGDITLTDEMKRLVDDLRITIKENISFLRGVKLSGEKAGGYVHHNRKIAAAVVGKGPLSDDLISGIAQHVTAAVPPLMTAAVSVDASGVKPDEVAQQRDAFTQEAAASGKPPQIAEKMAQGKLQKWIDERTLLGQPYVKDMENSKPIRDHLPKGAAITGFQRFSL